MKIRATTCAALAACASFMAFAIAAPAAAQATESPADNRIEAIAAVVPEGVTGDELVSVDSDSLNYSANDAVVEVPRSIDENATLTTSERSVQVALPFSDQAAEAAVTSDGIAVFDNENLSATVPTVHDDGSLQIFTVIDGPQAPTRYEYDITTAAGSTLTLVEGGGVVITDSVGNFAGAVTPPWAKDADGHALPTHYEVAGSTLTQVVDHSAATSYPVVADPWLGIQLFTGFTSAARWKGDIVYQASVTGAGSLVLGGGGGVGGYLAGGAVFRSNGWAEWTSRWPAITNKATLKQQYDCHVMAGNLGLFATGPYNLERAQSNFANWGPTVVSHHCNWTK